MDAPAAATTGKNMNRIEENLKMLNRLLMKQPHTNSPVPVPADPVLAADQDCLPTYPPARNQSSD
jgi:hypothetical protein